MKLKLVMTNIFSDPRKLKAFALEHGFSGIEWSFYVDDIPETPADESIWVEGQSTLRPLEVRYHCPFYQTDLGHDDPGEAKAAERLFQRIIRLVSKVGGRYLTIHIGLGHNSTEPLSWDTTIDKLRRLVRYGAERRVNVCLENLAWGWTSRPHLFEKLIRKSGAGVTFDIGHAYMCESVASQYYHLEDFVTPHSDRVFNAHIYHTETAGLGHTSPEVVDDIKERLSLLREIGCDWWVVEIQQEDELLHTKKIIDDYLGQLDIQGETEGAVCRGFCKDPVLR
ncbi:MAG: TIM barrel protein [Desulfobacteraceae bacterium]|jgi:sugar phosphate isomerase/epimerase